MATAPAPSSAREPTAYRLVDLGAASPSVATAVNDRGEVVGKAEVGDIRDLSGRLIEKIGHAFLWRSGQLQSIGALPSLPSDDGVLSIAYSISQRGVAVGASGSFTPISMSGLIFSLPFIYQGGAIRQLVPVGHSDAEAEQAFAINEAGTVVGSGAFRGFVYHAGKQIEIPPLSSLEEGNGSVGVAVNNGEVIVGATTVGKSSDLPRIHAFVWKSLASGRLSDLGTLRGYQDSIALAINDTGTIVGYTSEGTMRMGAVGGKWVGNRDPDTLEFDQLPTTGRAVVWRAGVIHDLGVLPHGPAQSAAFGINRADVIVGESGDRAVVWTHDAPLDLNSAVELPFGWMLVQARAINSRGWIVGWGTLRGNQRAFLLIPR